MSYLAERPAGQAERHVIIIDDQLGRHIDPEHMFKNCGIEVDCRYVRNSLDAREIIAEWAANGIRTDVLTCDDNVLGYGEIGMDLLKDLLPEIRDTHGPDFVPAAYFIHSAGAAHTHPMKDFEEPERLSSRELVHIDSWGDDLFVQLQRFDYEFFSHTRLREHCNAAWGATFATSEQAYIFHTRPEEELDAHALYELARERECTPDVALARLKPNASSFMTYEYLTRSGDEPEAPFKDATGRFAVGRIAFTPEDIDTLRKAHPADGIILCLADYTPAVIDAIGKVDGVIVLGEGSEHLKIILENEDKASILGYGAEFADPHNPVARMDGPDALAVTSRRYNHGTSQYDYTTVTLRAGDFVTIESQHYTTTMSMPDGSETEKTGVTGKLIPAKLEIWRDDTYNLEWMDGFAAWADDARRRTSKLGITANADTPEAVAAAIEAGAEGIGLIRTEHMLMADACRDFLATAVTTADRGTRGAALDQIEIAHAKQMTAMFAAANAAGRPFRMVVRLLDAPLDEFLDPAQIATVAARTGLENPRGCKLASATDGLYATQIMATIRGAKEAGWAGTLEFLIPNVETPEDAGRVRDLIKMMASSTFETRVGAMIENLSAVRHAGAIAAKCDFLSIGSNDLMSDIMGGVRRHDVDGINGWMIAHGLRGESPFKAIHEPLAGAIRQTVAAARGVTPDIGITACGQQFGTDFTATATALELGLTGVSVSPQFLRRTRVHAGHYALTQQQVPQPNAAPAKPSAAPARLRGPA